MKFKINHFNINVTNLENSIKFYKDNLGLEILREKKHPENKYHIVHLTDEERKITIELTWLKDKVGKYNLGDNEIHIGLTTDNFDEAYQMHKNNNVIIYENPDMGIYFIGDPDGYWIEILKEKK